MLVLQQKYTLLSRGPTTKGAHLYTKMSSAICKGCKRLHGLVRKCIWSYNEIELTHKYRKLICKCL